MITYRAAEKHNPENTSGYFVQNAHGATIAGPFATRFEAWAAEDKLGARPAYIPPAPKPEPPM